MNETGRPSLLERCGDTTPRDRRNLMRMLGTIAIWAVCFTGASQLIKRELVSDGPISWLLAALPFVAGFFVLMTYSRYLREADELQRKIQLQALAIGFGGTFFALAGYEVLERLGAPVAAVDDVTVLMAIIYSVACVVNSWRYR